MRIADINPPQIAIVTWLDTSHYPGWFGSQDTLPDKPLKMETVGWLIQQTKAVVILAMTVSEFKVGEFLVIPIGCVQSVNVMPPVETE